MISDILIEKLIKKYQFICVLFDNDEPGIAAMKKYTEKFGLPIVILPMEKDLSDSIKVHGIEKVKEIIIPIIKQAMK